MNRLMNALKVRSGEERKTLLLVGLMLFAAIGGALGGNATEALFFARFGVTLLPTMYILLGLFNFVTSLAITAMLGRVAKQRMYVALPLLLGFLLIGERLVILFNFRWFFAVMWLGMNVIFGLQDLLTWGLAGAACDTRQAKRLFPLFSAGGILGTVLGGLVTRPLASWLHAENLILFWAGTWLVCFALGRALTRNAPAVQPVTHARQPGVIEEMQSGYRFVKRSPIMQWVSYSAILFSVCFYSLSLPFSRGAAAQFPNADQLAGFLGLFQSLNTGAALLASLFLANRLITRFGIFPVLQVFPLIYLAGFGVLAVTAAVVSIQAGAAAFTLLVAFRFAQMAYMNGVANISWQAMFNVVPSELRDQVRAFVNGVPGQAGTLIAGLVLYVGEHALEPQQLYLIGLLAAALLVFLIWRASRAYSQALVDALHAGQPRVFFDEELFSDTPITGPARKDGTLRGAAPKDAWAISVVTNGLSDPNPSVRRVSAEIIAEMPVPEASTAMIKALSDEDTLVKVAALKGLARARAASALLEAAACLSDPEPLVRYQAIDTLGQLAPYPDGIARHVEPLLNDPDPSVRVQAGLVMLRAGQHHEAREILHGMAAVEDPSVRALALNALGESRDEAAFDLAVRALNDPQPVARKAAVRALASIDPRAAPDHLIRLLSDDDRSVRSTLAEAFGSLGEPALEPLVEALADPSCEECALQALGYLPANKIEQRIRGYTQAAAQAAVQYHQLALGLAHAFKDLAGSDGKLQLLLVSLEDQGKRCGLNALRALGLIIPEKSLAVAAAVENLQSKSATQLANALETLETVGERQIIRPLLVLWESEDTSATALPESWLETLLDDPHPWLRACAALMAGQFPSVPPLKEKLKTLSRSDPDETVRVTAKKMIAEDITIPGDGSLETLPTLSIMERILFLRRVPLFIDLQPAELKQVAAIASEFLFADQQVLAHQGEPGVEMYIIITGEVRVLVSPENQKEPREVARRRSGDYVGEMAVISQEPRMATLIADGPVRVLCLKQKQFESILRERPEISLAMIRTLTQRLKEASLAAVVGG